MDGTCDQRRSFKGNRSNRTGSDAKGKNVTKSWTRVDVVESHYRLRLEATRRIKYFFSPEYHTSFVKWEDRAHYTASKFKILTPTLGGYYLLN